MQNYIKKHMLILALCHAAFAETFNYKDEFNKWWNTGVNHKYNYSTAMKNLRTKVDNAIKQADIKLLPWYNPKKYKNIFSNWQKEAFGSAYTVATDLPKLHKFVEDICDKNNISKPFIVIPPFEDVTNAAATKLFRENGVIFIFPGIINNSNDEELEAILAHEIGHIKHNHINKSLALSMPTILGSFGAYCYLIPRCIEYFNILEKMSEEKIIKAAPKILMYLNIISTAFSLSIITHAVLKKLIIGRKFEQQADKFAMDHGHANGIKTFMTKYDSTNSFSETLKYIEDNKASLSSHDYDEFKRLWKLAEADNNSHEFWDEHPTMRDRVKAAEEYLNNQQQQEQAAAA